MISRKHSRASRIWRFECSLGNCNVRSDAELKSALAPLDPDRLRVHEGVCPEMGKLASVAAVFYSSYRNARIRGCKSVDEDTTRVQVARDLAGQVDIFRPEVAAQSKLARIRRADSRVYVRDASDRCNRTKSFFVEGRHS